MMKFFAGAVMCVGILALTGCGDTKTVPTKTMPDSKVEVQSGKMKGKGMSVSDEVPPAPQKQ